MNRRWRIWLIVGACAMLAVAIVVALVWPGEREPKYKGRKLSEWIQGSGRPSRPTDQPERMEAVQHIGTNALPYLLKWIEGSERRKPVSKLDTIAIRVMTKTTARKWLDYRNRKFYLGTDAFWALQVLGTNASPAIPGLAKLSHSTNWFVASLAVYVLKDIEAKATPTLDDYFERTKQAIPRGWTNSLRETPSGTPQPFAVGHVWRTNSKVLLSEESQTPSTNIQAPLKLRAPTTNSH